MYQKILYQWDNLNINWNAVDMNWNDVFYLIEIGEALGGFPWTGPWSGKKHEYLPPAELVKSKLRPDQYNLFIKILCKVNGIKTEEIKKRRITNLPEITMGEITRTMDEVFIPIVKVKQVFRSDI
jgi:hypothetical protein